MDWDYTTNRKIKFYYKKSSPIFSQKWWWIIKDVWEIIIRLLVWHKLFGTYDIKFNLLDYFFTIVFFFRKLYHIWFFTLDLLDHWYALFVRSLYFLDSLQFHDTLDLLFFKVFLIRSDITPDFYTVIRTHDTTLEFLDNLILSYILNPNNNVE